MNDINNWMQDCIQSDDDEQEKQEEVLPTCHRCGTEKISDLFKGIYCPRCNDWV